MTLVEQDKCLLENYLRVVGKDFLALNRDIFIVASF
jgi:hypothetical protein